MARPVKQQFLEDLGKRFPNLRKADKSQSLFEDAGSSSRIYIRYSKLHPRNRTFFGLREVDLRWLAGHHSIICFLWDEQAAPLIIPYAAFEDVFASSGAATDGQIKAQVIVDADSTDLYVAGRGRFSVQTYMGWNELNTPASSALRHDLTGVGHCQIQTILGAIGYMKGHDIWCPLNDRPGLDWRAANQYPIHDRLPQRYRAVEAVLSEVDVVWMERGAGNLVHLFEVEHTTSIYSGLLRFNDVHLIAPDLRPRFSIVAEDARHSLYVRQVNRPTFLRSGLDELCTFMHYENVLEWHARLKRGLS